MAQKQRVSVGRGFSQGIVISFTALNEFRVSSSGRLKNLPHLDSMRNARFGHQILASPRRPFKNSSAGTRQFFAHTPCRDLASFHRSKTRFTVKAALAAHTAPVEEAASVVTPPEFASRRCKPSHPHRYLHGEDRETGSRSGLCTCPRNYLVDRRLVP